MPNLVPTTGMHVSFCIPLCIYVYKIYYLIMMGKGAFLSFLTFVAIFLEINLNEHQINIC